MVQIKAQGCPDVDGRIVYAARNWYNSEANNFGKKIDGAHCRAIEKSKSIVAKNLEPKVEKDNKMVSIYPNPTQGLVNIQLPAKGKWELTITDMLGKTVFQQYCNGCEGIIKHHFDGKGLYLVKVTNSETGKTTTQKVLSY